MIVTNKSFIKIIQVSPVNFSLKSELEKEAILNSYKVFLKTFNYDVQILIQSKKEDISSHISSVESQKIKENKDIQTISQSYIDYIVELNKKKKSSTKNFYIVIKNDIVKDIDNYSQIANDELHEKYLKIKDCLSRCGNNVLELTEKATVENILFNYLNNHMFIFK